MEKTKGKKHWRKGEIGCRPRRSGFESGKVTTPWTSTGRLEATNGVKECHEII